MESGCVMRWVVPDEGGAEGGRYCNIGMWLGT